MISGIYFNSSKKKKKKKKPVLGGHRNTKNGRWVNVEIGDERVFFSLPSCV